MTSLWLHKSNKSLLKRLYSKKKEFAPRGANSFFFGLIPIEKGGRNENVRVLSL